MEGDLFERALHHVLGVEGEFSAHPADPGGMTRWGITEATARRWGYTGDMRELPEPLMRKIYREGWWRHRWLNCHAVAAWYWPCGLELFDTAVNAGHSTAGVMLQRVLNTMNRGGALYEDLLVDGRVGPATLEVLAELDPERDGPVVYSYLNCLQGAHYISIMEANPALEAFARGWAKRARPALPQ